MQNAAAMRAGRFAGERPYLAAWDSYAFLCSS